MCVTLRNPTPCLFQHTISLQVYLGLYRLHCILLLILPRLLQRSKECRGHYSTIYHAASQWIMRSDTQKCEEIRAFEVQSHVNYK